MIIINVQPFFSTKTKYFLPTYHVRFVVLCCAGINFKTSDFQMRESNRGQIDGNVDELVYAMAASIAWQIEMN